MRLWNLKCQLELLGMMHPDTDVLIRVKGVGIEETVVKKVKVRIEKATEYAALVRTYQGSVVVLDVDTRLTDEKMLDRLESTPKKCKNKVGRRRSKK